MAYKETSQCVELVLTLGSPLSELVDRGVPIIREGNPENLILTALFQGEITNTTTGVVTPTSRRHETYDPKEMKSWLDQVFPKVGAPDLSKLKVVLGTTPSTV